MFTEGDIPELKSLRGRKRVKDANSKNSRHRKRSGSQDGKLKLGNTRSVNFCSWCRPVLANRILNKQVVDNLFKHELNEYNNQHTKVNKSVNNHSAENETDSYYTSYALDNCILSNYIHQALRKEPLTPVSGASPIANDGGLNWQVSLTLTTV